MGLDPIKIWRACMYMWKCPYCSTLNVDDPIEALIHIQCEKCLISFTDFDIHDFCERQRDNHCPDTCGFHKSKEKGGT